MVCARSAARQHERPRQTNGGVGNFEDSRLWEVRLWEMLSTQVDNCTFSSPFQVDPSADWDKWAGRRPGFSLSYYCLIDPSLDGQVLKHCAASFSAAAMQPP